ncbi:hypothetical protein EXW28_06035 [Bacillus mycoides]|nr:hypothetical protein EXW37_06035 [Bacillus mycoides]QWG58970.1 hypothetical protein EXW26_06030 [Bacillus mycoides]QWG75659.1 hypothetical protein EXW63_08355 [Bacillus mycoides]QWH26001.1 hypothetical protein EXW50_06025 [Bacillus mycoides]QWH37233.1 hypothetical protein EXW28_06035 [Bacillus mycoides]
MSHKAEAARSECEGDGAPDVEALFASQEGAKPPNILVTSIKKNRQLAVFLIYLLLIFHFP